MAFTRFHFQTHQLRILNKMASISTLLAEDIAALSSNSSNESVLSVASLPSELSVYVASFLDFKSSLNIEATSKSHMQLVRNEMNPVWKLLHENRWAHGKLLWRSGPSFKRDQDGVLWAVDNDLDSWRDEVKRRVELDSSLPGLVQRHPNMKEGLDFWLSFKESGFDIDMASPNVEECLDYMLSLEEDGFDIFDWLILHHQAEEYMALPLALACTGRMKELKWALNFAVQAVERGDNYAAEFIRNQDNHLRCELTTLRAAQWDDYIGRITASQGIV